MATIERRIREADFSNLTDLKMSDRDWEDFQRGVVLFNDGKFWESHEAWEEVWRRHSENSRLFFQGLIQVAAGLHQLHRNILHGSDKHFCNALWKLKPFRPSFLGIDVTDVVQKIESAHRRLVESGHHSMETIKIDLTSHLKL